MDVDIKNNACYLTTIKDIQQKLLKRDSTVSEFINNNDTTLLLKYIDGCKQRAKNMLKLDDCFDKPQLKVACNGITAKDGYEIQNICIEAMDGYYLPVSVYVPKNDNVQNKKYPAVIMPMGHWPEGKLKNDNQILCANLALMGFVVANYDPIMQGERQVYSESELLQMFGEIPEDMLSVALHMQPGNLFYLLGKNLAELFLYDSIRVLDYICEREDVDTDKIAVMGQSGGGTQALYLSACDDRIKALSPIQCLSKLAITLPRTGIGDCEQSIINMHSQLAFDFPDFLLASFEKQILVNCGLQDFFYIEGVRHFEAELKNIYKIFDKCDEFQVVCADCAHEISFETRAHAYKWLNCIFKDKNQEKQITEKEISVCSAKELACFDDNISEKNKTQIQLLLLKLLKASRKKINKKELKGNLSKILHINNDAYAIELICDKLKEKTVKIKTLHNRHAVCSIYKNNKLNQNKNAHLTVMISNGINDERAHLNDAENYAVITPWAITYSQKDKAVYDEETCIFNASIVNGKNILEQRINQIKACLNYLEKELGCNTFDIIGTGIAGQLAAFVAFFDSRVKSLTICKSQISWDEMFESRSYVINESSIVLGLSKLCDFNDIINDLECEVKICKPVNVMKKHYKEEGKKQVEDLFNSDIRFEW